MNFYAIAKIGMHRGSPRLWIEGRRASAAGFLPGMRFTVKKMAERSMLVMKLSDTGERVVSRKLRGEKEIPVIDINSSEVLSIFEGFDSIRVVVQDDCFFLLPSATQLAMKERKNRLLTKLSSAQPLSVGSVSHGGGVLSHALHKGLSDAGIASQLVFANEIREEMLEQAGTHNSCWNSSTVALAAPLQELAFDNWAMSKLPTVEILEAGLPCSGASVAGRAKRALDMPEAHPEVGHLVVPFLALIARVNPAVILLENVKHYQNTASMCMIRTHLKERGYTVHESILDSSDWNALERRERLCMVGVTEGVSIDIEGLIKPHKVERRIAEILDPVAEDSPSWSEMAGLKAKQQRDKEAGKGFMMQIVTPFDTKCPTMTKGYAKVRSTDPKVQHPSNPDLLRQFTPAEHARLKGIPIDLIDGMSNTLAHELLGQSICYAPFRAVGKLIGDAFARFSMNATEEQSLFSLAG